MISAVANYIIINHETSPSIVASVVVESSLEDGQTIVESVVALMERNRRAEMQLAAARVICYLNR